MPAEVVDEAGSAEAVLRQRAEVLARPSTTDDRRSTPSIVLHIGEARVAVPLHRVRTVAAPGPVAGLPRAGHLLVGARLVGGEMIAVADLGPVLGTPSDAPAASRSVVVLDSEDAPLGVAADVVSNVEVDADIATGDASASALVSGVTSDGVLLLDVDAVLADRRFMTAPGGIDVAPDPLTPTKGSS